MLDPRAAPHTLKKARRVLATAVSGLPEFVMPEPELIALADQVGIAQS